MEPESGERTLDFTCIRFASAVTASLRGALELATRGALDCSSQTTPSRAPAYLRASRVEMRRLARGEDIMPRLYASQVLCASVKRQNRIPGIGIQRNNPLACLGLALANGECFFYKGQSRQRNCLISQPRIVVFRARDAAKDAFCHSGRDAASFNSRGFSS